MQAIKVPTIPQQELQPCNAPLWSDQDLVEMIANYFESFPSPTMGEVVIHTEAGMMTIARCHHSRSHSHTQYRVSCMLGSSPTGHTYTYLSDLVCDLMAFVTRMLRCSKLEEASQALQGMRYGFYERLMQEAQALRCDRRLWTFTGRATPEGYHDFTRYNA